MNIQQEKALMVKELSQLIERFETRCPELSVEQIIIERTHFSNCGAAPEILRVDAKIVVK